MADKLGLALGQITRDQMKTLQKLKKAGNLEEYEALEKKWGTTRPQLEEKYGKELVAKIEAGQKKTVSTAIIRTNRRTRKKYPVRRSHESSDELDSALPIRSGPRESSLWDTDLDEILPSDREEEDQD